MARITSKTQRYPSYTMALLMIATLNRVIFTRSATVCADLQPLVKILDDFGAELRLAAGSIPADILEIWQRLIRQAA